jgi:hypothetical protein
MITCKFDEEEFRCKVTEDLGFQRGYHAKAVLHNGVEIIVVKRAGNIWSPLTIEEKLKGY